MTTVADILRAKGTAPIYSVPPGATMRTALEVMADKGIGALMVMQGAELLGIVTERDYARKIALQGRNSSSTPVQEVMTRQVFCVVPSQSTTQCMALMTEKRIRHLPVIDAAGQVLGLISIGDLVKEIISAQAFTIEQLERYISGSALGASA